MQQPYPILEYDPTRDAIINPRAASVTLPEHCVLCFFHEVLKGLSADSSIHLTSEMGANPIYTMQINGWPIAIAHPGVGAPLAASHFEELIALGCRKFIAVGGSGVLRPEITVGHAVIITSAVRDEGTSYHYLPPSREVRASAEGIAALEATLQAHHVPYVLGKTWTTDGIYRETRAKMLLRKDEGCLIVEMEAAAFLAVAQFRGVAFGQVVYGGDDISGDVWDHRDWIKSQASTREKLLWLAAEACLRL